jgi:hypothetical protein
MDHIKATPAQLKLAAPMGYENVPLLGEREEYKRKRGDVEAPNLWEIKIHAQGSKHEWQCLKCNTLVSARGRGPHLNAAHANDSGAGFKRWFEANNKHLQFPTTKTVCKMYLPVGVFPGESSHNPHRSIFFFFLFLSFFFSFGCSNSIGLLQPSLLCHCELRE